MNALLRWLSSRSIYRCVGMFLIVGLGNPGKEYALHRHNVGFMAIDTIASCYNFSDFRLKDQGMVAEGSIGSHKVLLLKPMTYMNKSGQALSAIARFYKIPIENIIVIHDELDLAPGFLKIKVGGGHGGHNGLRSIDSHVGKEYTRIRFGIGHPGSKEKVTGYVLHNFAKSEMDLVAERLGDIARDIDLLIREDPDIDAYRQKLAQYNPTSNDTTN